MNLNQELGVVLLLTTGSYPDMFIDYISKDEIKPFGLWNVRRYQKGG